LPQKAEGKGDKAYLFDPGGCLPGCKKQSDQKKGYDGHGPISSELKKIIPNGLNGLGLDDIGFKYQHMKEYLV
jgi:hypothetical protein